MSYQLMGWAAEQQTGSITRKAVLMALANAANHHTGRCYPSVAKLCEETEGKPTAVKDALAALAEQGLIKRTRRRRRDGSLGTYEYTFPHVEEAADLEPGDGPLETADGSGLEPGDGSLNQEDLNQEATANAVAERDDLLSRPASVDRKATTAKERDDARAILRLWNDHAEQRLSNPDWFKTIIMRIREHPELSVQEHGEIIQRALADPWWKGKPSPAVLYGNGRVFEQALQAPPQAPAQRAHDIAQAEIDRLRRAS